MSGVWGTLATGIFAVPALASNLATGGGGLVYTGSLHQLGVQALGLLAVGVFTFSVSFSALWLMKVTFGIRVDEDDEDPAASTSPSTACGATRAVHPVPGGYGTKSHGHLGVAPPRAAGPAGDFGRARAGVARRSRRSRSRSRSSCVPGSIGVASPAS